MADTGLQMEEVFRLISTMNEQQQANLMLFAKELKKPTEIEQAKLDEERRKLEQKTRDRIEAARLEEESKERKKYGCSHAMPDGKHTWRGQVNSDGFIRPMCTICTTILPAIKATHEQLTNGVNFEAYRDIDVEKLEKWAAYTNVQL